MIVHDFGSSTVDVRVNRTQNLAVHLSSLILSILCELFLGLEH